MPARPTIAPQVLQIGPLGEFLLQEEVSLMVIALGDALQPHTIFVLMTCVATMVAVETSRPLEANKRSSWSRILDGVLGTALVLLALAHCFAQDGLLHFSAWTALACFLE